MGQLCKQLWDDSVLLSVGGVHLEADGAKVVAKIFQRVNLRVEGNSRP